MDELAMALDKFKPHECECCGWKMYMVSNEAKRVIYIRFLETGTVYCTECIKEHDQITGYIDYSKESDDKD